MNTRTLLPVFIALLGLLPRTGDAETVTMQGKVSGYSDTLGRLAGRNIMDTVIDGTASFITGGGCGWCAEFGKQYISDVVISFPDPTSSYFPSADGSYGVYLLPYAAMHFTAPGVDFTVPGAGSYRVATDRSVIWGFGSVDSSIQITGIGNLVSPVPEVGTSQLLSFGLIAISVLVGRLRQIKLKGRLAG